MNRTISDFLIEQARSAANSKQHISFHMPGHKGRTALYEKAGYGDFTRGMMACDITEIPGADALFDPKTTIRTVMDNYAELYGVRHTELLVNGSSAGMMAAIISAVPLGGKLILARNSHHSVFSALRLGGINPVYVRPRIDPYYNLVSEITPDSVEQACKDNPDASAVLVSSPNYYGMLSDIGRIAMIAHRYNMILIVDQAHGAHLRFFDYEAERFKADGDYIRYPHHSAEALGADIVVNSIHKTLLSFTGSAILNICSDDIDIASVSETLRMLQTTSPSYLLMGSLDINEKIMRGHWKDIISGWRENIMDFYRRAARIDGLTIVNGQNPRSHGTSEISAGNRTGFSLYDHVAGLDLTKINISMAELGVTGERLERELRLRGIVAEMIHGEFVMLMTGAGNTSSDYDALLTALKEIASEYAIGSKERRELSSTADFVLGTADVPVYWESVPLYESDGRVLYDPVIIYPPGTPVACPGEIINMNVITCISDALERGEKVSGVDEEGIIRVGTGY